MTLVPRIYRNRTDARYERSNQRLTKTAKGGAVLPLTRNSELRANRLINQSESKPPNGMGQI